MLVDDRYAVADNLSFGWLDALAALQCAPGGKLVHLVVRILDATGEDRAIRDAAQDLIDDWNARQRSEKNEYFDVITTRNTIFPAAWARRYPEPADLAEHYREHYSRDSLRGVSANSRGTYFGRLVAYPRGDGEYCDQLTELIRKLRQELATTASKSSRYEVNIFNEAKDTSPMGFPCLAHVSFHLHEGVLHQQAVYRNEWIVARAYGNYLGLAELQRYIAAAVGVSVGEMIVSVGHAQHGGRKTPASRLLEQLWKGGDFDGPQ